MTYPEFGDGNSEDAYFFGNDNVDNFKICSDGCESQFNVDWCGRSEIMRDGDSVIVPCDNAISREVKEFIDQLKKTVSVQPQ